METKDILLLLLITGVVFVLIAFRNRNECEQFGKSDQLGKILKAAKTVVDKKGTIVDFEEMIGHDIPPLVYAALIDAYRKNKLTRERADRIINSGGPVSD